MTVWVCLLLFQLWPWRTPWSPGSRKHLQDRLGLLICPFRNKSRDTVKIRVITRSSSCSSVGKRRADERIPANWSVRKRRHRTFAVAWTRGRVPLPGGAGVTARGLAFSCLCLLKGFTLSDIVQCSLPGPTGAAVLWANPSAESLLQHHHTCEALALLNYTSIAWFAFWKHRNEIPLLIGCEEGRMLIWAGSCHWAGFSRASGEGLQLWSASLILTVQF